MVAMSMADGYARLTNRPQAVIVHVDVGTQALGQAFHNASSGRAPVLVFAGSAPFTQEGELRGSRSEFIHWLQDVPDQRSIVSQYCRYAAEVKTGRNIKQMVNRALQFATSDPKGPVYLMAPREVLEEQITPCCIKQSHWGPITPSVLPSSAVSDIAQALVAASAPLVVVGYVGRNHHAVSDLVTLADIVPGLQVYDAGMSDMSFPADHPGWLTPTIGAKDAIESADVILVLDADVPWIPAATKIREDASIYHIDVDPLKQRMQLFYIPAIARYQASTSETVAQLVHYIKSSPTLQEKLAHPSYRERATELERTHVANLNAIASRAKPPSSPETPPSISYLARILRNTLPHGTIWASEAVTNHVRMADQIQATVPGCFITKGGSGLGWNGGAALGIRLAAIDRHREEQSNREAGTVMSQPTEPFVAMITGDGSFMFSAPSCAAWVASRYEIPTLTIVLDNGGWRAPRQSASYVWPDGLSQHAGAEELGIGFGPRSPRYAAIAEAGSGGWVVGKRVDNWNALEETIQDGVRIVQQERRGCVIEVKVE
jgi:thiamine pyrophosphate-dependent acetolactate synthase large subunit-like protein